MPLWLRKYTYNKLYEHFNEKETKSVDHTIDDGIRQAIMERESKTPTYRTKASKK